MEAILYAPRAVSRMTGLTAHCLRAWERRYGAVRPGRTAGGARRYSEGDVQRLRLLRRAVEEGHPISEVAGLADQALVERFAEPQPSAAPAARVGELPIEDVLAAARELDVDRIDRLLARTLAALGARSFACDVALPLLRRVGEEWEAGSLSPSEEHAASATLRSLLGDTLRREAQHATGPRILFSTPAGELHELGALIAATYALGLDARSVFLGPSLPSEDLVRAATRLDARAVALGTAAVDPAQARAEIGRLRNELPGDIGLWVGGCGANAVSDLAGIETIARLEELESHVRSVQ